MPEASAAAEFEPLALDRLKQYPFFEPLSDTVLRKLVLHLEEKRFAPGDLLLRLGDYSDTAYYLTEGSVQVRLPPILSGNQPPAILREGDVFGEIAALSRYPVTADVVADSDVLCLAIKTPALRLMFKQPELKSFKAFVDERYRSRTLASHLRQVDLFAHIDQDLVDRIRGQSTLLSFEPHGLIVEQGSPSDALYLVRGGFVKVAVRAADRSLAVTYLRKGDYAGELSVLSDEPWPFSLQALEHVEVIRIERGDLETVLLRHPDVREMLAATAAARRAQLDTIAINPLSAAHLQMAMDTGLINGQSVLMIDLTTCTGCDDCVRACADTHGGIPRFIRDGRRYRHFSIPAACYQCSDPVCMIGCPTGAISRPLGSLEVLVNSNTCIGCGNCASRCPWGNIVPVPHESSTLGRSVDLATKCDLCVGRAAGPACVQMCPHSSAVRISFKDPEMVAHTLGE